MEFHGYDLHTLKKAIIILPFFLVIFEIDMISIQRGIKGFNRWIIWIAHYMDEPDLIVLSILETKFILKIYFLGSPWEK